MSNWLLWALFAVLVWIAVSVLRAVSVSSARKTAQAALAAASAARRDAAAALAAAAPAWQAHARDVAEKAASGTEAALSSALAEFFAATSGDETLKAAAAWRQTAEEETARIHALQARLGELDMLAGLQSREFPFSLFARKGAKA